jgi:hypothetical protein
MISLKDQLKPPNFIGKNGKLFLVRCYNCGGEHGTENYLPAVASGQCVWCGWPEEVENDRNTKD